MPGSRRVPDKVPELGQTALVPAAAGPGASGPHGAEERPGGARPWHGPAAANGLPAVRLLLPGEPRSAAPFPPPPPAARPGPGPRPLLAGSGRDGGPAAPQGGAATCGPAAAAPALPCLHSASLQLRARPVSAAGREPPLRRPPRAHWRPPRPAPPRRPRAAAPIGARRPPRPSRSGGPGGTRRFRYAARVGEGEPPPAPFPPRPAHVGRGPRPRAPPPAAATQSLKGHRGGEGGANGDTDSAGGGGTTHAALGEAGPRPCSGGARPARSAWRRRREEGRAGPAEAGGQHHPRTLPGSRPGRAKARTTPPPAPPPLPPRWRGRSRRGQVPRGAAGGRTPGRPLPR